MEEYFEEEREPTRSRENGESLAGGGLGMGEGADFFCHTVESNAVLTRDVALVGVVYPWAENQDTAFGDSIEKCI